MLSEGPSIKAKLVPTAKYLLRTVKESFLYAEHCARHLPATSSHLILRTNFRLRWYHDYPLYVLRNRNLTTLTYLITPRSDLIASDVELGFELRNWLQRLPTVLNHLDFSSLSGKVFKIMTFHKHGWSTFCAGDKLCSGPPIGPSLRNLRL